MRCHLKYWAGSLSSFKRFVSKRFVSKRSWENAQRELLVVKSVQTTELRDEFKRQRVDS